MNIFDKLLQQNLELEGIIRVVQANPRMSAFALLADKLSKFTANIEILIDNVDEILHTNDNVIDSIKVEDETEENFSEDFFKDFNMACNDKAENTPEPEKENVTHLRHETENDVQEPTAVVEEHTVTDEVVNSIEDIKEVEEEVNEDDDETTLVEEIFNSVINNIDANDEENGGNDIDVARNQPDGNVDFSANIPPVDVNSLDAIDPLPPTFNAAQQVEQHPFTQKAAHAPQVINDTLSKAFNINDKYRFIREIFDNDAEKFNHTIGVLSSFDNLGDAFNYLLNDLELDPDDNNVNDFIQVVSSHFNSK